MEDIMAGVFLLIIGMLTLSRSDEQDEKGHDGSLWAFIAICCFIGACNKF